jgi:hypothetical protein
VRYDCAQYEQRQERHRYCRVKQPTAFSASYPNLLHRHGVVGFNRGDESRHALANDATVVNEPAVVLDAEAPSELCVSVTYGKVLSELSISDEMLPMRFIVPVNRE